MSVVVEVSLSLLFDILFLVIILERKQIMYYMMILAVEISGFILYFFFIFCSVAFYIACAHLQRWLVFTTFEIYD